MPVILVFCMVGAFAINNTQFDIGVMLAFGVLAFFLEDNLTPSLLNSEGQWTAFFSRPIAGTLGVLTILVWLSPIVLALWRKRKAVTA